ncbi:hypothetical protein LPJ61_003224 [Coemansia biformis]|uniref:PB1 domain-containing protein n=1 Tax=Coemansia biformis TaxID=1286918 RepID=A0A9W7YBL9_9FUNG|nr:hypothetical protein LPJ61_003224 [Coemansia biformis]
MTRLASEVYPHDSASMIEEIHSAVNSRVGEQDAYNYGYADAGAAQYAMYNGQMLPQPPQQHMQQQQQQQQQQQPMMPIPFHFGAAQQTYSNIGSQTVFSQHGMAPSAAGSGSMHQSQARLGSVPEGHFAFKLKTPSGKTHRFTAPIGDVEHVRMACVKRLVSEGLREAQSIIDEAGLAYVDDEGDLVHITGASDLADAADLAAREGKDRITLQVSPRALAHLDATASATAGAPQKTVAVGPVDIPERFLVPTAIGGGFVTALLCVWLAVKLAKN